MVKDLLSDHNVPGISIDLSFALREPRVNTQDLQPECFMADLMFYDPTHSRILLSRAEKKMRPGRKFEMEEGIQVFQSHPHALLSSGSLCELE